MDWLPIGVRLTDCPCLVVGGGGVAARKAAVLLRAGARLRAVAPTFCAAMRALASVELKVRTYVAEDLRGMALAVVATDDRVLNRRVSQDARGLGVPVNVVDDPALCTFVMPALVDRDPVLLGIWSSGAAPLLSRALRGQLEALLPTRLGALALLLRRHRADIKARFPDIGHRRRFYESVLEGPVAALVYDGDTERADKRLRQSLATAERVVAGLAYLIGAGPGDPELLTLRAQRCLQQADTVLRHPEVPSAAVAHARRDAHLRALDTTAPPATLSEDLVRLTRAGQRVAVLFPGAGPVPEDDLPMQLAREDVLCLCVPGLRPG